VLNLDETYGKPVGQAKSASPSCCFQVILGNAFLHLCCYLTILTMMGKILD